MNWSIKKRKSTNICVLKIRRIFFSSFFWI